MSSVSFQDIAVEVGILDQRVMEPDADFAERILQQIDRMDDEEWQQLRRTTQNWYNKFGIEP